MSDSNSSLNGASLDKPYTAMSINDLKKEMIEQYNITNFDDCIEKNDLVMKLTSLRSTKGSTSHPYPSQMSHISSNGSENILYQRIEDIDLVGNVTDPTALITLLHGLGDTALGWKSAASQINRHLGGKALFMVPTAPKQRVTLNMGSKGTAWYDIDFSVKAKEDAKGVMASARFTQQAALYYAKKFQIPTNKIIFGGFSQGGAVSIATGLSAVLPAVSGTGFVPAGILCLSGYFAAAEGVKLAAGVGLPSLPVALLSSESSASTHKCEVLLCHGTNDPIVNYSIAKKSLDALEEIKRDTQWGANFFGGIELKPYHGMMHSTSSEEIVDVAQWIKRVLSL